MQTRAAARKAAEASKLPAQDNGVPGAITLHSSTSAPGDESPSNADTPAQSNNPPIPTKPTPVVPNGTTIQDELPTAVSSTVKEPTPAMPKPALAVSRKAATTPKRKRGKAAPRQPMKGGWVLPHGMGVTTSPADAPTLSPREDEPSAEAAKDGALSVGGAPPSVTNQGPSAQGSGKQSKIGFRVTKPTTGAKEKTIIPKENAPSETGPSEQRVESQLVDKTTEITRLSASRQTMTDDTQDGSILVKYEGLTQDQSAPSLNSTVVIKEENPTVVADPTAGESTRKLLVIKGVVITDDVSTKSGAKIIVDATQILDPNFRMTLKRGLENKYGLTPGFSPYPYRRVPTPDDCEEVYRLLAEMHGECMPPETMPAASLTVAGCGEVPCVLDALLRTLISGYTKMEHADQAIKNLVEHYGLRKTGTGKGSIDWEKVRQSPHGELKKVIEVAGGGNQRAKFIKSTLEMVYEENLAKFGPQAGADQDLLSLDHMHSMAKDEALAKFVSYPGIGIKTAACVTLFCLQIPCFAVDTHVHRFCRWLGWTPPKADPDNCFRHTDHMVPDHLKYGLHQLFIRHGQLCFKCRAITKPGTKDWNEAPECPLEHLLTRTKDEAVSGKRKRTTDEEGSDGDDEEDDETEPKPKKPRKRMVKAKEPVTEDSSGAGMESEDDDDEQGKEEVVVEAKAKNTGARKTKPTKPPADSDSDTEMEAAKPASTSAARTKLNSTRITRASAVKLPISDPSETDEEPTEDEAEPPKKEMDNIVQAMEVVRGTRGDAESDSELSELESQQFEMDIDTGASQKEAVNTSQESTAASSVLSELSEMSDLTDIEEK